MTNYIRDFYTYAPGDQRIRITATEHPVYVLHTSINGSGIEPPCRLDPGQSWQGNEVLLGVFPTLEAADAYGDQLLENMC